MGISIQASTKHAIGVWYIDSWCCAWHSHRPSSPELDDLPQTVGSLMTAEQILSVDASVIDHAKAAQLFRWVGVSAITFLVWDTVIHIGDEVELIWTQPKTWLSWVYAYIRYFGVAGIASLLVLNSNEGNRLGFSSEICYGWIVFEATLTQTILLCVDIMLLLRIYVLYDKNRIVLWTLSTLLAVETLALVAVAGYSVPHSTFNLEIGCVATGAPPLALNLIAWLAPLFFQTVLFIMTSYRLFYVMKESRTLGVQSALLAFLRDGLWAYILMLAIYVLNVITFQIPNSPLTPLYFKWAICIVAFSGAHVMLNIRRLYARIPRTPTHTNGLLTTAGDMEFCMTDMSGSSAFRSTQES